MESLGGRGGGSADAMVLPSLRCYVTFRCRSFCLAVHEKTILLGSFFFDNFIKSKSILVINKN